MAKDRQYENRKYVISGILVAVVLIYIARLFFLQVSTDDYKKNADSNALLKKIEYPSRGIIYDRQGRLMVYNQPVYDVTVVMNEVENLDTLDFCQTVKIPKEDFVKRMGAVKDRNRNPGYSRYTHQIFLSLLSAEECGVLQEKLFKFPGFYVQQRNIRRYTSDLASHVLGDIGEISQRELDKDSGNYYNPGDYVGKAGIERFYEKQLRGVKGIQVLLRDVRGRIQGQYMDGQYDRNPVPGKNLTLSIDSALQALGERLLQHKIGAIVAIEPKTGEVLCMVSSPTFQLSTMSGKQRRKVFSGLFLDPMKPLYNRASQGVYPPGSTFKPAQGLVYLQEGIVSTSTQFPCTGGFRLGRLKVGCHPHGAPIPLIPALSTSCNAYFCWGLYYMMRNKKYPAVDSALTVWKDHMVSMGFGYRLGLDMEESRGFIPNVKYYDKQYGDNHWNGATIIHIGIGQAEIGLTPLQVANLGATIANKGYFITPHVVRKIEGEDLEPLYLNPRHTTVDSRHYEPIRQGMRAAVVGGTCRALSAIMPGIEACGKTGTAQNKGKDHGAFMGFAPYEDPKIAIAVYVENGGFGATYAVPMGGLIMQLYLTGALSPANEALAERLSNTVIHYGTQER